MCRTSPLDPHERLEAPLTADTGDVDHARHRIRAIQATLRPPQDFHASDAVGQELRRVERPGVSAGIVDIHAIKANLDLIGRRAAHEDRRRTAGAAGPHDVQAWLAGQQIGQHSALLRLNFLRGDNAEARADIVDRNRMTRGADSDRLVAIGCGIGSVIERPRLAGR